MPRDFFPRPEPRAVAFTANFSGKINADPQLYHVTPQRAAEYAALQLAYALAYQTARDPATRTRTAVSARKEARKLVEAETRCLGRMIRAAMDVTVEQKMALGLKVRRPPSRIPRPDVAPRMCVRSDAGQTLTVDLLDEAGKRRKPAGVLSAVLFWHAGDQPPATREAWKLAQQTTTARARVSLPIVLPPGTKVWLCAYWRNNRGQGPTCAAVYTHLGYAAPKLPVLAKAA